MDNNKHNSGNDRRLKPFLRWAGGKSWLTKHLHKIRDSNYNNYHEPFLGGGATFFFLNAEKPAFLSDLNNELIETYLAIQSDAKAVIKHLKSFANTENDYYKIRQSNFQSVAKRAAKFIYLNQTSFNGIYRVNLKGIYNVPYGFRTKEFLDEEALLKAQVALSNATIFSSDFFDILPNVRDGDLVFLDPPYTVSHNDNGFIKYNEKIFSLEDQIRLSHMIDAVKAVGASYILTNAAHSKIEEIFEKGDRKLKLNRANLIGGQNAERGHTNEFVFTNIEL